MPHGSGMPACKSRAEIAQTNTIRRRHPTSWSSFPYFRKEDILRLPLARSRMSLAKWKGDLLGVVRQYPRGFVVAVAVLLAILVAAYGLFGSKRGTALPADRAAATPQTASSSTTSSVAEPVSPPAPTGIELCGYGPVAIIDGVPQIPPEIDAAAEDVRGEISTELAARSNDRERALGLFLQNGAEASTALIAER